VPFNSNRINRNFEEFTSRVIKKEKEKSEISEN